MPRLLEFVLSSRVFLVVIAILHLFPGKDFLPWLCGPCYAFLIVPCMLVYLYEHVSG